MRKRGSLEIDHQKRHRDPISTAAPKQVILNFQKTVIKLMQKVSQQTSVTSFIQIINFTFVDIDSIISINGTAATIAIQKLRYDERISRVVQKRRRRRTFSRVV